jgi:hypothetical protein
VKQVVSQLASIPWGQNISGGKFVVFFAHWTILSAAVPFFDLMNIS